MPPRWPVTTLTPDGSLALAGFLVSARMSFAPKPIRWSTMRLPTFPVAPVTRIVMESTVGEVCDAFADVTAAALP